MEKKKKRLMEKTKKVKKERDKNRLDRAPTPHLHLCHEEKNE